MRGALLIFRKEVLELFKDKRTLFFTFLLPILLYPALFLLMSQMGRSDVAHREGRPSRILLVDPDQVLEPQLVSDGSRFALASGAPGDATARLLDKELDLVVDVGPSARQRLDRLEPIEVKVQVDPSEAASLLARDRLQAALKRFDQETVARRLAALQAPPLLAKPTDMVTVDVGGQARQTGKALGSFLPYLVMLMMFQGAMQHGIHVTAGEKERGTLQGLLATSLPRTQIIWGKLLFIFCMGLMSAGLNLVSLGVSLALALGGGSAGAGSASVASKGLATLVDPWALFQCFMLLAPLGLLFTSFILFMGIRARTTAEAGTSLMPGLFLILVLGAVSTAPGIERMAWLPYTPVLNVSLAIRKLFSQQGNAMEFWMAFLMTLGFSLVMTWLSARLLDRESVLFRQG